jgi:hypothetical protein
MNVKILHNTKVVNGGCNSFYIMSNVQIDGIDILRRVHTNCNDYNTIEWWMDIIPDSSIPSYATYLNPYDKVSGWLSFESLKDCYKYICENPAKI